MKFNIRAAVIFGLVISGLSLPIALQGSTSTPMKDTIEPDSAQHQQLIVWTSGDREVALKMVFMYAENSSKHGWMDRVRLLIWGPSGKLLVADEELQQRLKRLAKAGVELYACKACADQYSISEQLSELGVTVEYTGTMLANLQKEGWHVLSF